MPRTALISWCNPESRYAGGEALRRLLCGLPTDRIRWCAFRELRGEPPAGLPEFRAFVPQSFHWRSMGWSMDYIYMNEVQCGRIAKRIWEWLKPFDPEVLWVFPELSAVRVATRLQCLSGLSVHATVHDAPEFSAHAGLPRLYASIYQQAIRELYARIDSLDCVSEELVAHIRKKYRLRPRCETVVVRPTSATGALSEVVPRAWSGKTRSIGLCGSFRTSGRQWRDFLALLADLPLDFKLVSFTPPVGFPKAEMPANVSILFMPYADSDSDVVEGFRREGVDACYLGVWQESSRRLFGDTSLSSKLTTYAATAVPVIVHAAPSAAVVRLVAKYGAGVLYAEDPAKTRRELLFVLSNPGRWRELAEGARALCREEFDLIDNVEKLQLILARTAELRPTA